MADTVACRCPGNWGRHDGLCGQPVEKPHDIAPVVESVVGPYYKYGLCEECWNALDAAGKLRIATAGLESLA
jgi:hypothetical protein